MWKTNAILNQEKGEKRTKDRTDQCRFCILEKAQRIPERKRIPPILSVYCGGL